MRKPSTFFESSFSFSFLRTMPARKPRTECCCQPVAFIIAAIVVPSGDRSIVITRACFEPGSAFLLLVSLVVRGEGFATDARAVVSVDAFFADFDIELLRGSWRRRAATTEAPSRPTSRRGR